MLKRLFRRRSFSEVAVRLYEAAVAQGRRPDFYRSLGVPDSVDGRFDLIALHVWLLLRRLKASPGAEGLAQDLAEVFFADMDLSLREMGAADIGVGRRVKRMIEGFYGRIFAYDSGLAEPSDTALLEALRRNLYGTVEPRRGDLAAIAGYLRQADRLLAEQPDAVLAAGEAHFPPPPEALAA